jgi:hypothetical protein
VNHKGVFGQSHLLDELPRDLYVVDKFDSFPVLTDISSPAFTNPKDPKGAKLTNVPNNLDYVLFYRKVEKQFSVIGKMQIPETTGTVITKDRYNNLLKGLAKDSGQYQYEYLYINLRAAKKIKGANLNTLDDVLGLLPANDKNIKDRILEIIDQTKKATGVNLATKSRISLLYSNDLKFGKGGLPMVFVAD